MRKRPGIEIKPDSLEDYFIKNAQDRKHELQESSITASDVDNLEIKIEKVGSTVKLVTKVDDTLYKFTAD